MKTTLSTLFNKILLISAALICCTILSAACSNDTVDGPANNENNENTEEDKKDPNEGDDVIETGANLRFIKNSDGTYGFEIEDSKGGLIASQPKPAIIRIKNAQGTGRALQAGYKKINGQIKEL